MNQSSTSVPVTTGAAYALLIMVVVVWGANWPVMKFGLGYITPFWFALSRLVLGALTLFAVLAVLGRLAWPERRDLPILFSIAGLQMTAFLGLVHLSLQFVDAGRAAILAYTTPLWVTPAAILFLGERLTGMKILGLVLGLAGIVTLFNPLGFDWSDTDTVIGNLLLLLAAFCWALGILHIRAHEWQRGPLDLAPWQMLIAAVPIGLIAAVFESPAEIEWTGSLVAVVLYNGPLGTALGFWALVSVNRSLPAVSTSLAILGVPAFGFLSSVIFLDEAVSVSLMTGIVLILSGVAFVALSDWRRSAR